MGICGVTRNYRVRNEKVRRRVDVREKLINSVAPMVLKWVERVLHTSEGPVIN